MRFATYKPSSSDFLLPASGSRGSMTGALSPSAWRRSVVRKQRKHGRSKGRSEKKRRNLEWPNGLPLARSLTQWLPPGFWYDPQQDIIFSRMDALQRKFGYAYGYDDSIFLINAVIDCEPIFFSFAGKTWMIELWKGQYGVMTGCEIGVYNRAPISLASL